MRRPGIWLLLVATVVLVSVGIWYFVRDEYPFQIQQSDIVGVDYQTYGAWGSASGQIVPPPSLADWIGGMELDTSGDPVATDSVLVVVLRDGRQLRLELGADAGYGTWVTGGSEGERIGVAIPKPFRSYLAGLAAGVRADPRLVLPASPPAPSPSLTPAATPTP